MFGLGWPELIIILSVLLFLIVPISVVYFLFKYAVRKGVEEALESKDPSLQATTRICPHCERGVSEDIEAKFCPYRGKKP
jgi:hypothetical protein